MLRIGREKNRVSVVLMENDQFIKREQFTLSGVPEAMAATITARIMRDHGYGYVAIANFLTYGRI